MKMGRGSSRPLCETLAHVFIVPDTESDARFRLLEIPRKAVQIYQGRSARKSVGDSSPNGLRGDWKFTGAISYAIHACTSIVCDETDRYLIHVS